VPAAGAGILRKLAQILEFERELRLRIEQTAPVGLAEPRAAVAHSIDEDAEGFGELSGRSVGWWRARLNQASSCADILASLTGSESAG
jgi:hypothetical protein